MTDLTPGVKLFIYWCPICERQYHKPDHIARRGDPLIPQNDEEHECERVEVVRLAALDAERARADEAETNLRDQVKANLDYEIAASKREKLREEAAEARNRNLEAVAEAARQYIEAFDARVRRPDPFTDSAVTEGRDNIRAALAVLEEPPA